MAHHKYPLSLVLAAVALHAQSVAPSSDEVIELSPFTVSSMQDTGYLAAQTLAGTRLKTNVEDVAASIQILTPEFLQDVGASNLNDLFLYTTNTEAAGLNGNFSNAVTGETSVGDASTRVNPQAAQRVRGLAAADITRNYFLSVIPTDRFNTDRVEINRGANAILFGLGSPSGIANTGLAQAQFRNAGRALVQLDSEGSLREELDINQVLVPHRLALRVSALQDETKYYQRPAFENDRRLYAALAARPWKNGTFRAMAEHGSREANRPSTIPPSSTIDSWFASNATVRTQMRADLAAAGLTLTVPDSMVVSYNAAIQDLYTANYLRTADVNRDGVVNAQDDRDRLALLMNQVIYHRNVDLRYAFHPNMSRQFARVYQYNQDQPGGAVGGASAFMTNVNTQNWSPTLKVIPANLDPSGDRRFNYLYLVSQQPWRQNALLIPESLYDLNTFDFTRNLISGSSGFQDDRWSQSNFTFEQTALENQVGVELAFDRQTYARKSLVPYQGYTGIFIDLMENYLGQPNPNYGRPFAQARTPMDELSDERTNYRVTAYAKFDPARWFGKAGLGRWLGEQTFTALYSDYDQKQRSTSWQQFYTDANGGSIFSPTDALGDQRRMVNYIVYLGDQNLTKLGSASEVRLKRMQNQQIWNPGMPSTFQSIDPNTGQLFLQTLNTGVFPQSHRRDEQQVESFAGNWNGTFLDRTLVGLVGWRRDEAYNAGYLAKTGADELADLNNLVLNSGGNTLSAETFSWSVVGHLPNRWSPRGTRLSVHYGRSENFSLNATPHDFNGNELESPSGQTREIGFTASLFDGKFVSRVNWFETKLRNRGLSGTDNVYSRFINQGILKIYGNLLEAERHGNVPPSVAPGTGVVNPGTPNYGVAMEALAAFRQLIPASLLAETNLTGLSSNGIANRTTANVGDTEDVLAKGMEVEFVYNPIPNWRISTSVAKQETVVTNFSPRMTTLLASTDRLLAQGGMIGHLQFFPDASLNPPSYISDPAPVNNSIAQWLEANIYSVYRNKKRQEGRVSDEQRKWRVNVVTHYDFRHNWLKGWGVGAAIRWQDGAAIGYPTQLIGGELVADVTRPHLAPSELNIDSWVRYRRKILGGKLDWTVEFRVLNLNTNADELIPVKSRLSEDYSVAVWRVGPPRTWRLVNTFRF